MDEEDFNIIVNEFNSFNQNLSNNIKSSSIESEVCYLIENYWNDELEESINKYNDNKNKKDKDYSKYIPDYITNINSFSYIINCLQNDINFGYVSKKLLESSYDEDELSSDICIKYYSGNNKLIVELKDDKDNKNNDSILIIDPLNKNGIQKRAYIISSQKVDKDISFYEELIKKDKFNSKSEDIENGTVIFPFEKYSNISKFFIHIYFYERELRKKDLTVFEENKNEYYYLINYDWIIKFKKYYDYKSLQITKKKEEAINYSNLNQKFKNIYFTKNVLNYDLQKLDEEIKNVNKIKATQKSMYNIPYEINGYIINSQMKKLIESILNEEIVLSENKMVVKNNDIYLICRNMIKIGNLNKNLSFFANYIFSYISEEILESEKNSLLGSSIESYIDSINCNINNPELQEIKRNNEKIGTFFNKKLSLNNSRLMGKNEVEKDLYNDINCLNKSINKKVNHKNKISKSQVICDQINNNKTQTESGMSEEIKEYKNKIKEYEEKEKKNKESEQKLKEKFLSELKIKENEFKTKYEKLNINYENNQKELKKLKEQKSKLEEEMQLKNEQIKENEKLQKEIEKIKKKHEKLKGEKKELKNNEKKIKENYEKTLKEKEEILKKYEYKEKEINNENEKNKNNLIEAQKRLEKIQKEMNELDQKREEESQILKNNVNEYINKINILENQINVLQKKEKKEKNLEKIKNKELAEKNKELEKEIKEKKNIYDKLLIEIQEKEDELLNGPKPILVGLNNIGATCFMNSTLQCLSQTKALTNFFLNKNNEDKIINNNIAVVNKNALQLSPIYAQLIKKFWDKKGPKSFSPTEFRTLVEKMNPLFKQGQAGDSKDFIIFILEQIHKELKKPNPNKNQNGVQPLNQYDKINAANYLFNEFQNELSIISDTFFGVNETNNECINCKNIYNLQGLNNPICYNYGIFNCIIFPLEEVKNMKNNNLQNFGYNNGYNNFQNVPTNRVTLFECFVYNQKLELFTGENRNYCNICKQLYDSNYISRIFTCPNVLILILNRGKNNIYDIKLDFTETIDITQFVLQPDKPQMIYNLYGVITHIGQSGPNAHFVASCKSSINNKWYRFNDAFISEISDFQKEVHDFSTPYILFYQKS